MGKEKEKFSVKMGLFKKMMNTKKTQNIRGGRKGSSSSSYLTGR